MSSRSEHCWEAALRGEITAEMAAHLDECEECARKVEGVDRAAHAALAQIPMPSGALDERVLAAVGREPGARRRLPRLPRLLAHPVLVGAAAAAGAAALVLLALQPATVTERAEAVPIAPLTAHCPRDGDRGRLVVAGVWSGPEARNFARVLARFEEKTQIRVSYEYETRTIASTLQARLARRCAPDVALLPQPGLMAELARRGAIKPIQQEAGRLVRQNYSRPWRRLGTVDGRLYGVWFKAADKSTFWYSPAAFRAAGITRAPRTWAELLAAARRLAAAGVTPLSVAGADGWTLTDWFENVYLRSAGPRAYDRLARHELAWTDASVVRALRLLAAVFGDESLVGPADGVLETTFEESVRRVFGTPQEAAMVYEGDFVRSFVPPGVLADFFEFPQTGSRSGSSAVVGGDVAVMFKASDSAQALMRFLATPEAAEPWARAGGFLSPNRGLDRSAYPDVLARRAAASLAEADTVRFDLSDMQPPAFGARAEQGMWEIFQRFLEQPADVEGATRRLEAAATAARRCERANLGHC